MIPPTSIDGTDITGATIDGTDVTEITVDGDVVFSAGADLPTAGLLHRYDASELTGETDGQNVDTFPDLQGSADLSRTDTVEYESNGIGGLPSLRTFDSGDGIMTGGTVLSQPFAVWYAWNPTYTGTSARQIFADAGAFDVSILASRDEIFAGISIFGPGSTNGPQVGGWEFDGANSQIYLGTSVRATGDAGSNGTDGGFVLFNRRIPLQAVASDALYGEILIYDMNNSGYNATDIANYLGGKWGISV